MVRVSISLLKCLIVIGCLAAMPDSTILKAQEISASSLRVQGIAKPQAMAAIKFPASAQLDAVYVTDGARVKAGDSLARVDDLVARARVAAADAEARQTAPVEEARLALELARKQLQRLKEVHSRGAGTTFELDEKENECLKAAAAYDREMRKLEVAQKNLKLAEAELQRLTLQAPFDGEVTQVHAKVGTTVDPSIPVITIADLSHLEVELHVPVRLFGTIQVNGKAELSAGAPVNRTIVGRFAAVSPVINSASQTFRCVVLIDNGSLELPAGFTVMLHEPIDGIQDAE